MKFNTAIRCRAGLFSAPDICGLLTLFAIVIAADSGRAQEWTRFRGSNGSGISEVQSVPAMWGTADVNWEVSIQGSGHSSPVVWGNRLFLTSADKENGNRKLQCIDIRDGRTIWHRQFVSAGYQIHQLNSRAAATPVLDADHVYVVWGTNDGLGAKSFTHGGDEVWTTLL